MENICKKYSWYSGKSENEEFDILELRSWVHYRFCDICYPSKKLFCERENSLTAYSKTSNWIFSLHGKPWQNRHPLVLPKNKKKIKKKTLNQQCLNSLNEHSNLFPKYILQYRGALKNKTQSCSENTAENIM